ncbi:MAG: hypothetical protein ACRD6U_04250, partial [Nitrososphaeraceae archaeon]
TGMLQYIVNTSIIQCPSQSIKEQMEMNTNDVVNIKLPSGNENELALLPNSTSGVKFFCITSRLYSAEGITSPAIAELFYKINPSMQPEILIILDWSQMLIRKSVFYKIRNPSKLRSKMDYRPMLTSGSWLGEKFIWME